MQIKQNGVWGLPPDGIQWKQNGVWKTIEYVLATDDDFSGTSNGNFRYIGTDEYVEIPHVIKGVNVTSYVNMFGDTSVRGVVSTNKNVTNMSSMFQGSQATSLNLSHLDTSSVTDMSNMFNGAQAASLDLSSFNTSSVMSMYQMFYFSIATSINVSNFDTSSVTNMSNIFRDSKATSLDLTSFDTSNVTNMSSMFQGSQATIGYTRTQVDTDKFNSTENKPAGLTFIAKYVLATDDDFSGTSNGNFRYIGTDEYVAIPRIIKGVNVTSYASMFRDASVREVASNNKNVTSMFGMFRGSKATRLDLSSFDTSSVTSMREMFFGSQATNIDLSSFNTSKVKNMSYMFQSSKVTSLDLSSFDTSSVTNMAMMFYLSQATILDLSSFDTRNVTNMSSMFQGSQATIGYARTQADADKFNSTESKPAVLTFVVKPQGWSELSG